MTIFRNVVFLAALAGLLAGLSLAVTQHFSTVPLILQAETFENAAPAPHDHAAGTPEHSHEQAAPGAEAEEGWAPADGMERTTYTFMANIVTGIGFALLLVVASEMFGGIVSWRQGVLWGLGGFAVFTLAPGLGLPPELPAMPAADLGARQFWWVATVVATAAGLAMIAFRSTIAWSVAGVALIVLPHIFGAPQPADYTSPIPEGLHHDFIVAVTVTNLLFWVVLGGLVGVLRSRWLGEPAMQGKLA